MIENFYNPIDPWQVRECDGQHSHYTDKERKELERISFILFKRFVICFFVTLALFALCSMCTSCTTQKIVNSDVETHSILDYLHRIDSLVHVKTVTRQDSAWHQEILRQFQSIREKSDTSHVIVTDTAGNVIREKLIINNVREVTSESDRQEREVLMHRLEAMDSTMNTMRQQIAHSDSLLQSRQQTVEKKVPAELNWFQTMLLWIGGLVMVALAVLAVVWLYRKRTWWLTLLRKII